MDADTDKEMDSDMDTDLDLDMDLSMVMNMDKVTNMDTDIGNRLLNISRPRLKKKIWDIGYRILITILFRNLSYIMSDSALLIQYRSSRICIYPTFNSLYLKGP
jgi:hypothetical protein